LRDVCKNLEAKKDFHLVGFGVMTEAPKHYYKNYVFIDELSDLPVAIMRQLGKALLGR
jgi:cobalamin biosynthesis protein CobT